ncbi:MAG: SDR family oxidoreductase [Desulfatitalea sp.]|nr:SDR family oxidoreductase [Desulfatitalea sp.]NNK01202.1 SDR family oxidoreductase [Desulfatitalea sp.]
MRLKDKVAVITGASQGYGMQIAKGFAREGADIAICARSIDKLEAIGQAIREETRQKVLPVKVDITSQADVGQCFQTIADQFGRIDILVNNAGVFPPASILTLTEADLDMVFNLNLKGTFFCTQAAAKQMVKQNSGNIVTIGSTQSRLSWTQNWNNPAIPMEALVMSPYSASKGGLLAATRDWAVELGQYNIRANCIAMGVFPSEELRAAFPEVVMEYIREQTALKKLGDPADVVPMVLFLASDESEYMTGQTISYDGGWAMP